MSQGAPGAFGSVLVTGEWQQVSKCGLALQPWKEKRKNSASEYRKKYSW